MTSHNGKLSRCPIQSLDKYLVWAAVMIFMNENNRYFGKGCLQDTGFRKFSGKRVFIKYDERNKVDMGQKGKYWNIRYYGVF